MQKKSVVALLFGAALVTSLAAHAEGLYVTVGLGQSLYDEVSLSDTINLQDAKPGSGSIAVGYKLNQTWDAEVGYIHFGNAKYSGTVNTTSLSYKLRTQSIYAAAVGNLPFTPRFSGHGKLGLAINRSTDELIRSTSTTTRTDLGKITKSGVLLGLGLAYQFTPTLSGLLDYTYVGKVGELDTKVSMVSLGLRYNF